MQAFLCLCVAERGWLPCLRGGKRGTQTAASGRLGQETIGRVWRRRASSNAWIRSATAPPVSISQPRPFKQMPVALFVPRLDPDRLHIAAHDAVTGGIGEQAAARDKPCLGWRDRATSAETPWRLEPGMLAVQPIVKLAHNTSPSKLKENAYIYQYA